MTNPKKSWRKNWTKIYNGVHQQHKLRPQTWHRWHRCSTPQRWHRGTRPQGWYGSVRLSRSKRRYRRWGFFILALPVFNYLMDEVDEWSTEYSADVMKIADLASSPHSWNKKVLFLNLTKVRGNYRFPLGVQMFRLTTEYTIVIELLCNDKKMHDLTQVFTRGTSSLVVLEDQERKYEYKHSPSERLRCTNTWFKLRKTGSSPPVYMYFTVHMDAGGQGGYPQVLNDSVYLIAHGVSGFQDVVASNVYDAHKAYEIGYSWIFTETRQSLKDSIAPLLSTRSGTNMLLKCGCPLVKDLANGWCGFLSRSPPWATKWQDW